jgi:hypothetical protein
VQLREECVVMPIGQEQASKVQDHNGQGSNVVAFRQARPQSYARRDQKNLMEAVYSAGSLPVPADDRGTKAMAARLQLFGFVVIEEVATDGSTRRLRSSEAIDASPARPWRVSKPSVGRKALGAAEASGCFTPGARVPAAPTLAVVNPLS